MCICITVITETASEWISQQQQKLTIWIIRFPAVSVFVVVIRAVNTQSGRVTVRLVAGHNWLICRTLARHRLYRKCICTGCNGAKACQEKKKKTQRGFNHLKVKPCLCSSSLIPADPPPHPPHPTLNPTRNRVYTSGKWRPMQAGSFNEK